MVNNYYDINSDEFQFLLKNCAGLQESDDANFKRILSKDLDVNVLIDLTRRHQLISLAYGSFKKHKLKFQTLEDFLKEKSQINQVQSLETFSFMKKFQTHLNLMGFKSFYFKGIPLSLLVYGDIGMRQILDVDIWVEERGLLAAEAYLNSLGYFSNFSNSTLSRKQFKFIKYVDYHCSYLNKRNGNPQCIEVHWKMRDRLGNFNFVPSWPTETTSILGLDVINHYDHFVFLCVHGSEHAWFRLKWLYDIYYFMINIKIDYEFLFQKAIERGSQKQVAQAFYILNRLLGVDLSEEVKVHISKFNFDFEFEYIKKQICYRGDFCDNFYQKILNARYIFAQSNSGIFNLKLVLKNLTNMADWQILKLPNSLFYLYFILHPFIWVYRKIYKT